MSANADETPAAEPVACIDEFWGRYRFLSNFAEARVEYDGQQYPTVENAYQAAKCARRSDRTPFLTCGPGKAKKLSRGLAPPADWDARKEAVMEDLLRQKFALPKFRERLLATGSAVLIEGNRWGDRYWGVSDGAGENRLGLLLMRIRDEG